jgi:O-antigen/teichoic acid export membrane protein
VNDSGIKRSKRGARKTSQTIAWRKLCGRIDVVSRGFLGSTGLPSTPSWTRLWLADSAVLVTSQAMTIVATSAAAVLIARQLDPHEWGIFSGFLALSLALSVVIQFGTGTWLLRELSRLFATDDADTRATASSLVNAALVLNAGLAATVLAAGTVTAMISHLDGGVTLALVSMLAYSGLIASSYLMEAHLRASRRVGRVAAASLLEKYLLVTLIVAVAVVGGGVPAMGIAYVVAGLTRVAFVHRTVFPAGGRMASPRGKIARVFRGSVPFALTNGCLSVIPKLDAFLLLMLSATSAGYFALGDRVLGPALIFPEILSITLYPFFAQRVQHFSPPWMLSAVFAAVGAVIAVTAVLAAPGFVPFVFGTKYMDAVPAVRVFALALPVAFATGPLRVYGFSRNQEKRVVVVAVVVSVAGSVGIVTGQWTMGVVAAAAAYVFRYLLLLAGLILVALRANAVISLQEPTVPGIVEVAPQ